MALTACQRRELDAIQRSLQATDVHLAAMFAVFTRLTTGEAPTGIELVSRLPKLIWPRVRSLVLPLIAVALVISGVVAGATASGASTTCLPHAGRYVTSTCAGRAARSVQCQQKISDTRLPSC